MQRNAFDAFFERVSRQLSLDSQQELAALLNVNRSAVTQAKSRGSVPQKWLLRLSRDYGLNPDWLEQGRGEPRAQSASYEDPEFFKVPKVQARLCAGGGSFEVEAGVEEYYAFRHEWLHRRGRPESMVLMDVFGNSMEPEIKEGDTVLIDQNQKNIIAGGIYAVGVEDTVMVKRMEKRPHALVLISDNLDYSPIVLQGNELETVRVIGKLIWIGREYR